MITIPASFDEVARELSIEAARRAGLAPKLLEEPAAAFYDWMSRARGDGVKRLVRETSGDANVLVVDDDPSLLRVLRLGLRASGHEVVTAIDGGKGSPKQRSQHRR